MNSFCVRVSVGCRLHKSLQRYQVLILGMCYVTLDRKRDMQMWLNQDTRAGEVIYASGWAWSAITETRGLKNNRHLLFYGSRGQKSKIKQDKLHPKAGFLPPCPAFTHPRCSFLSLQLHPLHFCLHLHMAFLMSSCVISSSYKDNSHWIRVPSNPVWPQLNSSYKTQFPKGSLSEVLGEHELLGDTI